MKKENPFTSQRDALGFRHFIYAFLIVHAVLFPLSGFRAWVQVYDVDLRTSSSSAAPGTRIVANIETSGRIAIDVDIVANQGARTILLGSMRIPSNEQAIYDPRPRRDSIAVSLTSQDLKAILPGPVAIIATAKGRPQFTRMPPPLIKHLVLVAPSPGRL